ncbi:MAG: hypothetical protein HGA85_06760 [Nanoarchaeota archaeon]|nr:hypothetical protein [Nanoarchaeota archaeon]
MAFGEEAVFSLRKDPVFKKSLLRNDVLPVEYKEEYLRSQNVRKALVEIYDEVRAGKSFSPGIFVGTQGKLNCAILSRHVMENILGWDFSESVTKVNYKTLYEYNLRCSKSCFVSLYELLRYAYPEIALKPYYFKRHRDAWMKEGTLDKALAKEAIRELVGRLIEKDKKKKVRTIPQWISYRHFQKPVLPHGATLSYLLNRYFDNSPAKAIIFAYPELELKPHYFKYVPKGFWQGRRGKSNARKIMLEVIGRLTDPEGAYKMSKEEVVKVMKFRTYGKPILPYGKRLSGMLQSLFNNSPQEPLELVAESLVCNELCDNCRKKSYSRCFMQRMADERTEE